MAPRISVYTDKILGPVLSVRRVASFDEGPDLINANASGNGPGGVHSFTRGEVVTSRWPDPSHGGLDLGFPQNA